jgi:hypothetical protein
LPVALPCRTHCKRSIVLENLHELQLRTALGSGNRGRKWWLLRVFTERHARSRCVTPKAAAAVADQRGHFGPKTDSRNAAKKVAIEHPRPLISSGKKLTVNSGILRTFPDPGFDVIALRACEGLQFVTGALGLYTKKPRLCSALGAARSFNRIRMRRGRLVSGHRRLLAHRRERDRSQPPTPDAESHCR